MKRIGLVAVATAWLLASCQPSTTSTSTSTTSQVTPDPAREGSWLRAEGKRQGMPIVWQMLENHAVAAPRTQLLVVSWHFKSSRNDGQLDEAAKNESLAIEKTLVTALEAHAQLVAVMDFNTQHDWYFYADDAAIKRQAEDAVKSTPQRDILVTVEDDATGRFYSALKQKIQ